MQTVQYYLNHIQFPAVNPSIHSGGNDHIWITTPGKRDHS